MDGDDLEGWQVQVREAGILQVVEVPLRQGVPAALVLCLPALLKQGGLVEGHPAARGAGGQEALSLSILALRILAPEVRVCEESQERVGPSGPGLVPGGLRGGQWDRSVEGRLSVGMGRGGRVAGHLLICSHTHSLSTCL